MNASVKAKCGAETTTRFSFETVNRDIVIPSTARSYDDVPLVEDIQREMDEPANSAALAAFDLA